MNRKLRAGLRVALLAVAAGAVTMPATAAEAEKNSAVSQAEIEKKLEDARRKLDMAAREVAELSMSMSEHAVPTIRHFTGSGPSRAILGINLGSPRDELPEGVAIVSVSPGGAAESAGLKAGDVLLSIDDKQLKRSGDRSARQVLLQEMGKVKPGEKVKLSYRRDKKVATATVAAQASDRLFPMPPVAVRGFTAPRAHFPALAAMRAAGVFGSAELVPLTPKLGQYFGTDKGLLVVRAPEDSRFKLEDGDVIVDIGGRTPSSPSHAFRILGSYQAGEKLTLNVLRQKKKMSFDITIPDEPAAGRTNPFMFHHQVEGTEPGFQDSIIIGPGPGEPPPPPPPPHTHEHVSADQTA